MIIDDGYMDNNKDLNILVVQEGAICHFPMELIPIRFVSDTSNYHYLGEFANITYAPSLSSFVELSKEIKEETKKEKSLLISANPIETSSVNYMDNLFVMRSDFGNIKYVDDEIFL